jgi:UDP-N-acetylmuramoyl-L-alanyl-D-glutamate--2,6-diaminopimelate ligase
MKLTALVGGLPLTGDLGTDPEVFGVRHDSRTIAAGDLFVAWRGAAHDGVAFAAEALSRGAAAVLADRPRPAELATAPAARVPWLVAAEPRRLLAELATRLYGRPDLELRLIGVTGTNGKSTTVELVAAMLDAAGAACARLGTLGVRFPGFTSVAGERTTPEASDLYRVLAELRVAGAAAAAMEVSSHALAQGRVAGLEYDLAVFTNLSRDHFDFHAGFEDYFAAKAKLFEQLKPGGRAVVNVGDEHGRRLCERLPGALGFGGDGEVVAGDVRLDRRGIRGGIVTPRGELAFDSPLLGRYNLDNLLAAVAAGEALELDPAAIAEGIRRTKPLPGRMEPVAAGQSFPVVVDYAHTDAALEAAIRALKELAGTRVVVVFGCGGDRDPGKRPRMGRVAGTLADLPIVTSDNPRSEDPLAIIAAVEEGLRESGNTRYRVVPDRREAIRRAVAIGAAEGLAVLVARLRRLQIGQYIREEGPQAHQAKAGTPTMGGC